MSHIPMTAPAQTSNFSSKKKNDNLQLIPMGSHPAIIYAIVNIGTHAGEWQGKPNMSNKLKLMVEFPTQKQLYYEEDTEATPSALIMDFSYSISKNNKSGKKSKLLEMIEGLYGPLQQSQYLTFDLFQLLDLKIFANVIHYTKKDGTIGAKIASLTPFNPAYINPDTIIRHNKLMCYATAMGFECQAFAELIYFFRKEIKESEEGKAHIAAGGRFFKLDENGAIIIDDGNNDMTTAPSLGKLVMTNPAYTYEAMIGAGWTDQSLIDNGYARREAVAPIQIPTPAPVYQAFVQAPMSIQPQMPLASSAPTQSLLTMLDLSAPYQQFISAGWTDELLIQHGKALRMAPAAEVFPSAPPIQAPPVQAPPNALPPVATAPVPMAMPTQEQLMGFPIPPAIPQAMAQGVPAPQPTAAAMFTQAHVAPVQQMGVPAPMPPAMPQAPVSGFEQAPTAPSFGGQEDLDDLPF